MKIAFDNNYEETYPLTFVACTPVLVLWEFNSPRFSLFQRLATGPRGSVVTMLDDAFVVKKWRRRDATYRNSGRSTRIWILVDLVVRRAPVGYI